MLLSDLFWVSFTRQKHCSMELGYIIRFLCYLFFFYKLFTILVFIIVANTIFYWHFYLILLIVYQDNVFTFYCFLLKKRRTKIDWSIKEGYTFYCMVELILASGKFPGEKGFLLIEFESLLNRQQLYIKKCEYLFLGINVIKNLCSIHLLTTNKNSFHYVANKT